ncbi:helix-turn-helix domain-containing protein [Yersinia mollaretii]|uniref:helix-turn-helix domain-containing protein n=1 Tax=Yersinia mollaretii TaxID=33060 RepID=UPI003CC69A11
MANVVKETSISRNAITLIYKETVQKVDWEAVDKLCALFQYDISKLLERTPEE